MCLLCVEIAKQTITPESFWRNFRELLIVENDHVKEVIKVLKETPKEFQEKLSSVGLENESED